MADFNREVSELAGNHSGYDDGKIVYVGYEGEGNPSNYYDILAVYMVKYGVGDTATIMNDTSKDWLKTVVEDMCTYTTSTGTETETTTNEDGTTTTTTTTYLYVNVTLKSCYTQAGDYGFTQEQLDLLNEFMSPENLTILGYSPGGGGSDPGVCSLSETEIQAVLHSYKVAECFVVGSYDNSIKTQSGEEELTLFTCAERGTKRFVVKCIPVGEDGVYGE